MKGCGQVTILVCICHFYTGVWIADYQTFTDIGIVVRK